MRVMTVRQPWALHIIQSGKDVENRVRNIAGTYRGPVAIHAGLAAMVLGDPQKPTHSPSCPHHISYRLRWWKTPAPGPQQETT